MCEEIDMIKMIRRALGSEVIRYAITGGIVTLTNAAGYLLNKFWVYRSKNDNFVQMFLELCRFILARGLTGLLDGNRIKLYIREKGCFC